MADRRMVSKKVFYSEEFLALSGQAKALYIYMCLECDDDGFCPWPGQVMRNCGAAPEDLQRLIDEGFLMRFGKIVVVTHWRVHNSLKTDRLRPVAYPGIARELWISAEGEYSRCAEAHAMNLLEYRMKFLQDKCDPLKELRRNPSEFSDFCLDSKEKIREVKKTQDKTTEGGKENLVAAAGLPSIQRQTLEIIMGPDGLQEALREIGTVEGDVYEALLEHWKRKSRGDCGAAVGGASE